MTKKIGIIGAGKVGIVLAQLALAAGYAVDIAGSGMAEKITMTVDILAPGAQAMTTKEVVMRNDVIILALPLSKFKQLDSNLFTNKLVLDAMNYWWETDGQHAEFLDPHLGTSELVQAYFKRSIVVKAFNHMGYHDLYDEATVISGKNRQKAIAIASDNKDASDQVAQIITDFGFEPLVLTSLSEGIKLQPGVETFGANLTKNELQLVIDDYAKSDFGKKIAQAKNKV